MSQVEIYYNEAQTRLASQNQLNADLNSKTLGIVAFCGALVGAGAILLNVLDDTSGETVLVAFILSVIVFGGVAACGGIGVMYPRKWYPGPKLSDIERILGRDEQEVRKWVAEVYQVAVERNSKTLETRARAINLCVGCAIAQVACLATMAIAAYHS